MSRLQPMKKEQRVQLYTLISGTLKENNKTTTNNIFCPVADQQLEHTHHETQ